MGGVTNSAQIEKSRCNFNHIPKLFVILLIFQWFTMLVARSSSVSQATSATAEQPDKQTPTAPPTYNDHGGSQDSDYFFGESYDPSELYKLDSDYCKKKSFCSNTSETFPDKLCHCDNLCGLFNDCCHNYVYNLSSTSLDPPLHFTKYQFECVPLREIVKPREYGITMVTKCFHEWDHKVTKRLCEHADDPEDILLRLPVTEKTNLNIMHKNMYCAQCNYVEDFQYWKPELTCRHETGVRSLPKMKNCTLLFKRPRPDVTYRTCQYLPSITTSCSQYLMNSDELIRNCTEGTYLIVYDEPGNMYRNEYCARCNGVQGPLFCDNLNPQTQPVPTSDPRSDFYSLKLLADFNIGTVSRNDGDEEEVKKCEDSEIYDSIAMRCREIFCAPPLKPINGVCKGPNRNIPREAVESSVYTMQSTSKLDDCTLFRLNPSEFEFRNNSELFIFSQQKVYTNETFRINGSDVFICSDKFQKCTTNCKSDLMTTSEIIESYITLVGLLVSIFCLALTLIVYLAFPQLLNTPGKILISLIIALLMAHVLFATAAKAETVPQLCFTVGILIHYFFLAAFCWMNVIALDLWMTFSNRFITSGSENKVVKRFILYSLYGWLVPLGIVLVAVILEFMIENSCFKPRYGNEICWISSKEAVFLFFAGPLALFKLFDIVSFIFTVIHIARAQRQGQMATRKKNTCSLIINIKLSLIMGLTWVFAFVANTTNDPVTWYLFIIFNSLQGLFVAICFLCTKTVGRLFRDKYKHITTRLTSGTQIASLS